MPPKNPLSQIAGAARDTVKHPRSTVEKVVGQARGTASVGKMVAGSAAAKGFEAATKVKGAVDSRRGKPTGTPHGPMTAAPSAPPPPERPTAPAPEAPAPEATSPVEAPPLKKAPAKKTAKKAAAKKSPAKKTAKAPAKKAAKKTAAKDPGDVPTPAALADKDTVAKEAALTESQRREQAEDSAPGGKLPPRQTPDT